MIQADIFYIPDDPSKKISPVAVLDRRMVLTGGSAMSKLCVQWDSVSPGLAT
jgi:hypothetical protein